MILVDTSIWVEFLQKPSLGRLADEDLPQVVTCGPVLQEVLQGLLEGAASERFLEDFLALPRISDPTPSSLYLEAAEIYRLGRRKGYAIRSANDCLVAAIAISNKIPILHRDRDFDTIAKFTALRVVD
ncbi:MAG: PIN domain-containing protein [Acidobacteria bacterium]|nr:PIN domain-containing protein [Acidobacteriota bacterium]